MHMIIFQNTTPCGARKGLTKTVVDQAKRHTKPRWTHGEAEGKIVSEPSELDDERGPGLVERTLK